MGNRKSSVRIGMVGCGAIAELFHLPALARDRRTARGLALAEPNATRLDAMQQRYAARVAVQDYRELAGEVDGVILAVPPALHATIAKWFLERNIPVLCEKPLTETYREAAELVELARARDVPLAVNQTRRLFPTYGKIRQLIAAGTLGTLQSLVYHDGVKFDWPAASPHHFVPGARGAWSDTGIHLLDAVCYWLDGKPEFVESWNDSCGGPEAMATVRLRHADCEVEIKVSRLGRLRNGFHIAGTKGSIDAEAEDWDEFDVVYANGRRRTFRCGSNRLKYHDFAHPLIANFIDVCQGIAEPLISAASTLPAIKLLEQAYEEAQPYADPWNDEFRQSGRLSAPIRIEVSQLPRVLVTGAGGFVGGRVVEAMLLSGSAQPVAGVRRWSGAARVACHPVDVAICDILDPHLVDASVRNVAAIVHCAYTDDQHSIVTGTRHLLDAAVRHRVPRFVYLSSAEVYGPDRSGVVTEDASIALTGRMYGDAKWEAEQLCHL
ncbi:MAG: Gfo/Idh/MocA family oxidoreductase, partial [Pirellulaceae bacterium]